MGQQEKNAALVLSGGGARGMAHIGVIEGLLENGFRITSVAGTSIGSVVGAVYLSGKLPEFRDWVTTAGKFDFFKLMDLAIGKNGIIKGEKVFKQLKKFILDVNIEDLEIPYAAVATDINSLKPVIFRSGSLVQAIRASVAIPTVLKPLYYEGMELVDGGVLNPLPLDCIGRKESEILVAVNLNADIIYKTPKKFKKPDSNDPAYSKAINFVNEKWSKFFKHGENKQTGFFDLITKSIYAMQLKLTQMAVEKYKPDLMIDISKNACEMYEFHRAEELIAYGKQQFELSYKNLINPFS
jgi:NTE family protein